MTRTPPRGRAATLVSGTSWQAVSQLVPLVVNLAMTPYIIHGLGPARYSVFLLITSITALLSQFDGGIGQSALRFFTIHAGRDDRVSTTRLLVTVSAIVAVFSIVVSAVVFVTAGSILSFFHLEPGLADEATLLLRVLTMVIGFILLRNLYNAVIAARQLFRHTALAILTGHLVYTVGLILTIETGWGLYGIAVTMVMQQLIASLFTVPVGLSYLDRRGLGRLSRTELREFFAYAWKVQISGLVALIGSQKDQLVAGRLLSAQESGPFGQGTNFANQFRYMPFNAIGPIQAMIGSEVGAGGAQAALGRVETLQRVWVRAVTGWIVIGIPATYVGVQKWLPDSFAAAAPVAAILLVGHFFALIMVVLKIWALTLGHPEIDMRSGVVGLLVNLALSVALGLSFGMLGVVVATSLGQLAAMLHFSFDARRVLSAQPRWFVRDIPVTAALVGGGACAALELAMSPLLPRGALGLLCAALLAAPPLLVFAVLAFGPATVRSLARRILRR